MGKEVVCRESPKDPGKRSRLWQRDYCINVLQENAGTKKVEGLMFGAQNNREAKKMDNPRIHGFLESNFKIGFVEMMKNLMLLQYGNSYIRDCGNHWVVMAYSSVLMDPFQHPLKPLLQLQAQLLIQPQLRQPPLPTQPISHGFAFSLVLSLVHLIRMLFHWSSLLPQRKRCRTLLLIHLQAHPVAISDNLKSDSKTLPKDLSQSLSLCMLSNLALIQLEDITCVGRSG